MDEIQKKVLIEKYQQHIENAFDVLTVFDNEGLDYDMEIDDWTDMALSHLFVRHKVITMIKMHGKLDIPEDIQLERAHLFQAELGKLVTMYTGIDSRDQVQQIKEANKFNS